MKTLFERLTDNQELQEIQYYFRCLCFIEHSEDSLQQHIEEGCLKKTKFFEEIEFHLSKTLKILHIHLV